MVELLKDERTVRIDGDNFVVRRVIEEQHDAETYLRAIHGLMEKQMGLKKQIAEVDRKIIQQIRKDKRDELKEIDGILKPLLEFKEVARVLRDEQIAKAKKEIEKLGQNTNSKR